MEGKKYLFCDVEVELQESNTPLSEEVVYVCRNNCRVDLICPCGCGAIITLPLNDGKPQWKIIEPNTISPSINRIVGCKSHFSIKNGIVEMH